MNKKFSFILEIVWLCIAMFSFIAGTKEAYFNGLSKSYPLYIIGFIALIVFFLRRYHRMNNIKNK